MKVQKSKALELVDQKILQFEEVLANATYENRYDNAYEAVYYGSEALLADLYSKDEAMEFRRNVTSIVAVAGGKEDHAKELQDYRNHIGRCIAQLKVYRERIENFWETLREPATVKTPKMKITREGLFSSGQVFDAIQLVADIFSCAKQSIMIVDNYIDEKVMSLMTTKDSKVEVKIITRKVSPAFRTKANEFNKQYGGLSIRLSMEFHDRFVIIDGVDFYHFGASIKDLGKKGFMFSRIEEPEITKSLSLKLTQEWKKAKIEVEP